MDIGFKSEGVVPVRELSIRKDADPSEIVNLGDEIEALVLQKEDKDGRLVLSKKRASTSAPGSALRRSSRLARPSPARLSRLSRAA